MLGVALVWWTGRCSVATRWADHLPSYAAGDRYPRVEMLAVGVGEPLAVVERSEPGGAPRREAVTGGVIGQPVGDLASRGDYVDLSMGGRAAVVGRLAAR